MATTSAIQSLKLASGDPTAYANVSKTIAGQIPQNVPDLNQTKLFGDAVTGLLKQYQNIEKYPFAQQGFNAQKEQASRIQQTPQNLIGAAPSVQAATRNASAAAVQPTITGAENAGRTFASRLSTLGDVINSVSALQQQEEGRAQQAKADAQNLINNSFAQFGPDAFLQLPTDEQNRLEKMAGYPPGYISNVAQAFRDREAAQLQKEKEMLAYQASLSRGGSPSNKQAITDASGKVVGYFNPDTGETTYYDGEEGGTLSRDEFRQQLEQSQGQSLRSEVVDSAYQQYLSEQQNTQPLPKDILTKVQTVANQFDNEQVVKNFNVLSESNAFIQNISNTTTNPSDDQALVYSLAKALDPTSAVREGEYATVQKYSQSLVKSYGKSVLQAAAGTGFLSEEARKNIKATIQARYNAALNNYQNVYNEYARRINNLTGRTNGSDYLTQYSYAPMSSENQNQSRPPLSSFEGGN